MLAAVLAAAGSPAASADPRPPSPATPTAPAWSAGLLPIGTPSTAADLATPAAAPRGADDSAPDPIAESADPAVRWYEEVQRESALARDAAHRIPAARADAAAKAAIAAEAVTDATVARDVANAASARLDAAARGAYMAGGVIPFAPILLAADTGAALDALVAQDQFAVAAAASANEAAALQDAAGQREQAAAAALQAEQAARAHADALVTQVAAHQEAAAAAARSYTAYTQGMQPQVEVGPDGCPVEVPAGTLRDGAEAIGVAALCQQSVLLAATPQAAKAIKWAFSRLGAPYACKGVGRLEPFRFDCSSLVSRAYSEGAGVPVASREYAPSTRNMMPWDGVRLDPHYEEVPSAMVMPGDLILTRSCTQEPCAYQHVTMALANGYILHTNRCGDVAHVSANPGYGPGSNFVVARRVVFLPGESPESAASTLQSTPVLPTEADQPAAPARVSPAAP